MNATSNGREAYESDDTSSPVIDGRRNAGSCVPNGSIVDGVAVMVERPVYAVNCVAGLERMQLS